MEADPLLGQLRAQIANRALFYLAAYDALADAIGAERAEAVLTRAVRLRGRAVGKAFRCYAPADLAGLKDAFLGGLPGGEALFRPELRRCDAEALEVKFQACPLQQAWQDAGVPEAKRAMLCRIAGAVDLGTFEAAGFGIENRTWTPGTEGCCHLTVTPGRAS